MVDFEQRIEQRDAPRPVIGQHPPRTHVAEQLDPYRQLPVPNRRASTVPTTRWPSRNMNPWFSASTSHGTVEHDCHHGSRSYRSARRTSATASMSASVIGVNSSHLAHLRGRMDGNVELLYFRALFNAAPTRPTHDARSLAAARRRIPSRGDAGYPDAERRLLAAQRAALRRRLRARSALRRLAATLIATAGRRFASTRFSRAFRAGGGSGR